MLADLAAPGLVILLSTSCSCLGGPMQESCWQLRLSVAVQRA